MTDDYKDAAWGLYKEIQLDSMRLFWQGKAFVDEGNYDEGLPLMHESNRYNEMSSYLLQINFEHQCPALPERAESRKEGTH